MRCEVCPYKGNEDNGRYICTNMFSEKYMYNVDDNTQCEDQEED